MEEGLWLLGFLASRSSVEAGTVGQLCASSLHLAQGHIQWDGGLGMCRATCKARFRGAAVLRSLESVLFWPCLAST